MLQRICDYCGKKFVLPGYWVQDMAYCSITCQNKDMEDACDEKDCDDEVIDELDYLVNSHWEYVNSICEKMYKDAFKHGYKHGKEDKK